MKKIISFAVFFIISTSFFGQEVSKKQLDSLLSFAEKTNDTLQKIAAYNYYAWDISYDDFQLCIKYATMANELAETLKDKKGISKASNTLGTIFADLGLYEEALKKYNKAVRINKELNDSNFLAVIYANIGNIYANLKNYQKAKNYYLFSKNIFKRNSHTNYLKMCMSLINVYVAIDKKDSAEYYYKIVETELPKLKTDKESIEYYLKGVIYSYLAPLEIERSNFGLALKYLQAAEKIFIDMESVYDLSQIYLTYGEFYDKQNKYEKAIYYYNRGIIDFSENTSIIFKKDLHRNLANVYAKSKQYEKAYENQQIFINLSDSLNKETSKNKLLALEEAFKNEKTALELSNLKNKNQLQESKIKNQNTLTTSMFVGLLISIFFGIYIFINLKQKKKANQIITNQNSLLEQRHKEITDSITYAKRIQNAILPSQKVVEKYLPDSFISFNPKDIVAGDFYWLEQYKSTLLFAAADCTGHGVPGAMVSVVCNNALNRCVREYGLTNPGEILNTAREIIVNEFSKSNEDVKDGMDIALCSLRFDVRDLKLKNKETTALLQYAGANNPLWIIRNLDPQTSNFEFIEIKPNKQPIGKMDNPQPFTTHTIELQKEDTFYIFTDGFADQFGGKKGKKMMYKPFKELLLSIQDKTMDNQKIILEQHFETWKGNLEQIDDVCIIGVRI